jgi:hypothetical protein
MIQSIAEAALCAGYWLGDQLTSLTGFAAIRIPLERASRRREVTLDLPGYMQINSYACGATTAAMIVRYFRPRLSFGRVYRAVDPQPDLGAGTTKVIRALRSCGLRVSQRQRLKFAGLRKAIDLGRPVMVCIQNPGAECDHWVVVYGYSIRPDRVFIATNDLPWSSSNRMGWKAFERIWKPRGHGLICWRR